MNSNMMRRVAFAAVAIPALVLIVWLGSVWLGILLAVAAILGIRELFQLAETSGVRPLTTLGALLASCVPASLVAVITLPQASWLIGNWSFLIAAGALIVIGAGVFIRTPAERPLASIAVTLFGIMYASALPAALFIIRHGQWGVRSWPGTALAFFPLIVTWVCDTAAMLGGQAIGGAKMAPAISPGKTWAGGVAGVVGGTVVGAVYAAFILPRAGIVVDLVAVAALALVLSVIGQIGDLAESLFKREAGVKDSSSLIPGHGGMLDRLDSLYFAIPAAAIGFHLMGLI